MTGITIPTNGTALGNNATFVTGCRSMSAALQSVGLGTTGAMSALRGKSVAASGLIPLPTSISLDAPKTLGTNICTLASYGSTTLSVSASPTGFMQNYQNIGIRVDRNSTTVGAGSVAEFKFRSSNFFVWSNTTHLAVILRGLVTTTTLQGKGIVIGNVSAYPPHSGVCKPTSLQHDIGVESFWSDGNCVYGSVNNPQSLKDGVLYSVKIVVNDVKKTIAFRIRGEDGYDRTQLINDAFYTNSGQSIPSARQFAIGGVADTSGRTWSIQFGDIAYYNVK